MHISGDVYTKAILDLGFGSSVFIFGILFPFLSSSGILLASIGSNCIPWPPSDAFAFLILLVWIRLSAFNVLLLAVANHLLKIDLLAGFNLCRCVCTTCHP